MAFNARCLVTTRMGIASMGNLYSNRPAAVTVILLVLFLTGCFARVDNITVPVNGSIETSAKDATIVIVQPSTHYSSLSLLDGNGKLLGQLHDRSYTVVNVPPGPIRLYVLPERLLTWGDRIQGEVTAGRVYYATISLRFGGIRFNSLNPRSPDRRWEQRDVYLTRGPYVEMDPAREALLLDQLGDTAEILEVIEKYADRYPPNQIEVHTILPEDGL